MCLDALVVVGIDADVLIFQVEGVLTFGDSFELVVGLKVRPSPHTAVDDVRETLAMGHLETAV